MNEPAEPGDPRLDYLFVRYWENALTEAEAGDLERLLTTDPAARRWFRLLTLQAVTAADSLAVSHAATPMPMAKLGALQAAAQTSSPRAGWSRRRLLAYLGSGLAASVVGGAGFLGWRGWNQSGSQPIRVASIRGNVRLARNAVVTNASAGQLVPPGTTVHTDDLASSALLAFPDGSSVSLAGDSALTITDGGHRLELRRGNADADVRPQQASVEPLVLATTAATLTTPGGALVALGHLLSATEVGVQSGSVTVSAPTGEPLGVVGAGEMLTVRENGDRQKQSIPVVPVDFAWDLSKPLPDGWHVGSLVHEAAGPVVCPDLWFDPYHKSEMYQVRSNSQWARGFCRLLPESEVRVRYRVDRRGPGQIVLCVRSVKLPNAETGVVEWNGTLEPGRWQDLTIRAAEMLDNDHAPKFGPPWVAFLVIANTYEEDLGLKIADFRVTRPGRPAPGA